MATSTRIPGEEVKCHQCDHTWPRQQGGLECPNCQSEFVEILSDSTPPSPDLAPRPDTFGPWHGTPDPDEDEDEGADEIGGRFRFGIPPERVHRQGESRTANGNSSFSFTMFGNEAPMLISNNPARRGGPGGRLSDDDMANIGREVEGLFQDMIGATAQGGAHRARGPQNQSTMHGRPPPGFPFGRTGQQPQHGQGEEPLLELFGTLFQAFGGVRLQTHTTANTGIFAEFQRMMDPANVNAVDAHGDYVFGQRALDRVISQLMEQHQNGNAPGPASEAAIRALPKKKVEEHMLDDNGKAECSICMDAVEVGDPITVLPCKHWFHESCIKAWLVEHDTCPHCRKGITPEPGANGKASQGGGSGPPSTPPEIRSPGSMPARRQGNSGTARTPTALDETSPRPQDVRTARERYYSHQNPEDLERRQTQGGRYSRTTPTPSNDRRRRSNSHRSGSNGGNNSNDAGGGGFSGWVRSFGGSGGER